MVYSVSLDGMPVKTAHKKNAGAGGGGSAKPNAIVLEGRLRCAAAELEGGTPVDRLTGLLNAYFGMGFDLFSKSEHMPELEETFSKLARTKIVGLNTEYEDRLARFLRSLEKTGEIGGPPRGLSVEQIVHILMRTAEGAKHDPEVQGDRKALERRLRELAILVIAAMRK